jgi:CHAT domain-containing protein/tetratricopeptide (TPR) repeat protein
MRLLLLIIITGCLSFESMGQSDALFFETTDSLYENQQGERALQLLEEAQPKYASSQQWDNFINCYIRRARYLEEKEDPSDRQTALNAAIREGSERLGINHPLLGEAYQQKGELAMVLGQTDSAVYFLDQAIARFKPGELPEDYCEAQVIKAVAFFYANDFPAMEAPLLEAVKVVEQFPEMDRETSSLVFDILAIAYVKTGEYDKSLKAAHTTIDVSLANSHPTTADSLVLANRYNNLGFIYSGRGDDEQAVRFYKIALRIRHILGEATPILVQNYNNIGKSLQNLGRHQEASTYFNGSLRQLKQQSTADPKALIDTYIFLAENALKQAKTKESLTYLQEISDKIEAQEYRRDVYHYNLARIHRDKGQTSEAIREFEQARSLFLEAYGPKDPNYLKTLYHLGSLFNREGRYQVALDTLQQALTQLHSFPNTSPFSNPTLEGVTAYVQLLPLLEAKAYALKRLYPGDPRVLPTYRLANATVDRIRQDQLSDASKLVLSTNAQSIYSEAIDLLFEFYQQSGNPQHLEEAFLYMEKSKSLVLLEGIREYQAQQTGLQVVPDSDTLFQRLLQEEKQLKLDRVFYERKLAEAQQNTDSLKIGTFEATLADIYERLQNLQRRFQTEYPVYHQANYDLKVATIQQVQEALLQNHPDRAILEYHIGEQGIFLIRITAEKAAVFRLEYPDGFDGLLINYRTALTSKDPAAQYQDYISYAHQLYQILLAPVLNDLPANFIQLYIIPDGKLGYIAFESLLTALPASEAPNYSLNNLDYLLKDWMISYGYSSTLLIENTRADQQKRGLTAYGGFAPVFDQSSDLIASERSCEDGNPLGALANSEKSVRELQALLGGRFFLRDEATKEQFLQEAGRYRILHLSTHACVDDRDPLFNRIFFANDFLPTYEVYNMELNADLVVLSACETGFGELVEGEGIMSLARSFMYAGSPSVVTSLWNANDYSTTQIMIDFHKNLKAGLSKDQALHQAKLDYLAQASARQSAPYLWSNFILIGNPAPVPLGSVNYWWMVVAGALIIAGIFIWRGRQKD